MSEAHEKTRIRQLEDAAAHWEHKYGNAKQYNRNLEARIRELEAALSKYGDHLPGCKREDMMPCNCGFATTQDRTGEP